MEINLKQSSETGSKASVSVNKGCDGCEEFNYLAVLGRFLLGAARWFSPAANAPL